MYGIRNLLRYGIGTKCRMESSRSDVWNQDRRGEKECSLSADAMPDRVGIPYTLKRDDMPLLSQWIKKDIFSKVLTEFEPNEYFSL